MISFEAYCGTNNSETITIDIDRYGYRQPLEDKFEEAFDLLKDTMDDVEFANDGNRNMCAVNGCIALHVLGFDAVEWFDNFCKEQKAEKHRWFKYDLNKFMEHVERVGPYLSSWGPHGNEANALNYVISY